MTAIVHISGEAPEAPADPSTQGDAVRRRLKLWQHHDYTNTENDYPEEKEEVVVEQLWLDAAKAVDLLRAWRDGEYGFGVSPTLAEINEALGEPDWGRADPPEKS